MHPLQLHWPLYGLRVRCADVELRLPDDDDLAALADVVAEGVHDPASMPFAIPWSDAPPDERVRGLLQFHWRMRAAWSPEAWTLALVVVRAGQVVGVQGLGAEGFAARREVHTGSYLGLAHQGLGTGKLMRAAVLHLAFAGLGAACARSSSMLDNPASRAVSTALGYREDGTETLAPRGVAAPAVRFRLDAADWRPDRWPTVEIAGLEPCRALFGA